VSGEPHPDAWIQRTESTTSKDWGGEQFRVYHAPGAIAADRATEYCAICAESINDEELIAIRAHLEQERTFGSQRFRTQSDPTTPAAPICAAPGDAARSH